jgi:hypothetical protein
MPGLKTFGNLLTYTKQRLGIENNESIQDSELRTLVNLSMASLDELLVNTYEEYHMSNYLAVVGTQPSAEGPQNMISTPPDFFKLRGVDFGSPGMWITIFSFNFPQRNYFNNPYSNMWANYGNQVQRKVRVVDQQIMIEPMNLSSGQYQVWYTPQFTWLVEDTDKIPYDMDTESWIEYVVALTGEKVYQKLLLPVDQWTAQKAYYEDKARNNSKNRMSMGPQTVCNVRNRSRSTVNNRGGFGI